MKTLFGSHLSIAGGMEKAAHEAEELGMGCVQVFTKNQRQWKAPALKDETVERWCEAVRATKLKTTVSHDSYLINLASKDAETRKKSLALLEVEIANCDALGIPWLVMHPGAHLGDGEAVGIDRIVAGLDRVHEALPDAQTVTCLEVTAGQGTNLGYRLEHLSAIIDKVALPERLAVCLDTAHLIAAGYDLTSGEGAEGVVQEVGAVLGFDRVRVMHINDSKVERGKRVDRHEHIGYGTVSPEAFSVLLNHKKLGRLPLILETPKAEAPDGRAWDLVNMESLVQMRDDVSGWKKLDG
ncbi:deoxyribonuclease IV [Mucisphaera calidilacus]|uniref:Probable endonuclease 4 n=1 Tax=Mucisphaera calidilacus TaxID=2527982 RepID=A0A518BZ76_9BACT|nr:deoxyribonuclease IV [Mucisphaera calidilacus]QDU72280.1 putative endonuclease 4 [Mucisphaera calidilacus]